MKGLPKVTNFAKEFQSGGKFHSADKSLLHQARKGTFSRYPKSKLNFLFELISRALPDLFQHSLRGEPQLSTCDDQYRWGESLELESYQCHDLLQLPAAGVLPRQFDDANARRRQIRESHFEAPPDHAQRQSVEFRRPWARWRVHQRYCWRGDRRGRRWYCRRGCPIEYERGAHRAAEHHEWARGAKRLGRGGQARVSESKQKGVAKRRF